MLTVQNMVYIDSWVGFPKQVPRAFDTSSGIDQGTIHIAETIRNQNQNRQIKVGGTSTSTSHLHEAWYLTSES
jgi:hypothetical protein